MDPLPDCDALIVGAGLSGMSMLHRLRKLGLKTMVFESGTDFGGVWYWNRYPGARVDSEWPYYQLNIPEVYRDWDFSERFPAGGELRAYMAHVDKVLGLRKDVQFGADVVDTQWNETEAQWIVKTRQGHAVKTKYLILCSGLLHSRHVPEFPGLDKYQGEVIHTAFWPEGLSVKGKRVALVGAGSTGVQVTQALSKEASNLTIFLRQPGTCLPMGQRKLTTEEQQSLKRDFSIMLEQSRESWAGFPGNPLGYGAYDVSSEERERIFEDLWVKGGFAYVISTFNNFAVDKEANKTLYDFWARKTRPRITNPKKRDIMVPAEAPYWFGTKRCPLEHDYYECIDRENVEVVSLIENPLTFVEKGVLLADGEEREFDVVILATGFDAFSGSYVKSTAEW
jgi:cation diffusion facilitator CzcD-associated flavoprotein CzcO